MLRLFKLLTTYSLIASGQPMWIGEKIKPWTFINDLRSLIKGECIPAIPWQEGQHPAREKLKKHPVFSVVTSGKLGLPLINKINNVS